MGVQLSSECCAEQILERRKMFSKIIIRQMSSQPMKEVVVIGGGLMGTGIAQISAQSSHKTTLVDLNQDILNKAEKRIQASISRVAKKTFKDDAKAGEEFVATSLANIGYATNAESALATADIIIEAISEVLPLKQKLFKQWDGMCPGKAIGKYTVTCKDTNGFIVNALLGPYISDAIAMVERGDATYQDVDAAVRLGLGYPMGPFELLDYTGIDLHKHINDNAEPEMRRPSKLIDQMVAEG